MAILSSNQILQILQKRTRPEELESCRIHDVRARFHTEPVLYKKGPKYLAEHLAWVGTIIDSEKVAVYTHLLTLPIETIDFTEGVFDELKKVFEAQNRFIGFEFTNPQLMADFEEYRKQINDFDFWKTKGFKAMKSQINSFIVIDLPALLTQDDGTTIQKSQYPEPYYYFLDCQEVISVEIDDNNNVQYIVFKDCYDDSKFYAFDDAAYRVYQEKNNTVTLLSETFHELGYTPVRSFWSTPYNDRSRIQKAGPISNSLSKLDWLLFMYTSTKHSELAAGFPVEVIYEQRCDYKDAEGNACDGGKIRKTVNTLINTTGPASPKIVYEDCPTCKNKRTLGAGRLLTAPAMSSKDDVDLIQGMNRISADVESLKYLLDRIDGLETTISINIAGYTEEDVTEAMNKEQVRARFQSQYNVLIEVKENFENIHKFVINTVAKLRYGKAFVGSTVNYGDKFFIYSIDSLQESFQTAKNNGFPNFELGSQITQIIATKYKENPSMLERARVLSAIEPYTPYKYDELISLNEKIGLNTRQLRLKVDFDSYVSRFEREFMNISMFMQYSPFESKVEFIQAKLLEYVDQDYTEQDAKAQQDKAAADAAAAAASATNPPLPPAKSAGLY
jgi:hypothetical protein